MKKASIFLWSNLIKNLLSMTREVICQVQWLPGRTGKEAKNQNKVADKFKLCISKRSSWSWLLEIQWEKFKSCSIIKSPWRKLSMSSKLKLMGKVALAWNTKKLSRIYRKMKKTFKVNYLDLNTRMTRIFRGLESWMIK